MNIFLDMGRFVRLFNLYLTLVHVFLKVTVAIAIVWLAPLRRTA